MALDEHTASLRKYRATNTVVKEVVPARCVKNAPDSGGLGHALFDGLGDLAGSL
jgi:hypothetical protein